MADISTMTYAAAFIICAAMIVSTIGYGRFVECAFLKFQSPSVWTNSVWISSVFGFGIIATLGAIPNHLGITGWQSYDVIILTGCGLFAFCAFKRKVGMRPPAPAELVPPLIISGMAILYATVSFPPSLLNHHDDFYKYLPRLMELTQTGTLRGTEVDELGVTGLGLHTYMQGFITSNTSYLFVNGYDLVLCFLVGGLCLDALAKSLGLGVAMRSLVAASYVVLNPMTVNTSAQYSLLMFILGAAAYGYFYIREVNESGRPNHLIAVPTAMLCSAALASKFSVVTLVAAFGLFATLLLWWRLKPAETAKALLIAALGFALPYLFWLSLHVEKMAYLFAEVGRSVEHATAVATTSAPQAAGFIETLLRKRELAYGGRLFEYLGLIATIAVSGVACAFIRPADKSANQFAWLMAATSLASILVFFMAMHNLAYQHFARYNVPAIFIGYWITSVALASLVSRTSGSARKLLTPALVLILAWPTLAQSGLWIDRATRYIREGHGLMYFLRAPRSEDRILAYSARMFSRERAELVSQLQNAIPSGSTFLTYFESSFLLNYKRNRILHIESFRPFSRLFSVEADERPQWLARKLRDMEVDYVLLQRTSLPPWWPGEMALFRRTLLAMRQEHHVAYEDSSMLVLQLNGF